MATADRNNQIHCMFCDFVSGQVPEHINGLPFLVLRETAHTLSFLSAYQPDKETGHLLVIPKNHARFLEDISPTIQHELMDEIAFLTRVARKIHPASNLLLNNGREAGQHEPHVHFHIIPREPDDHLLIDSEPGSILAPEEFVALHQKYVTLLG